MYCEWYDTRQTNGGFMAHSVDMLALTTDTCKQYVNTFDTAICSFIVGDRDFTVSAIDLLKVSAK